AGEVAELDAADLLGRHHRRIENVDRVVGSVRHPDVLFVGSQRDAVARPPVALDRALLVSLDFHSKEFLPAAQITYLEPQQTIYVYEAQRIAPVDRERTDDVRERSDGAHDRPTPGVSDRKKRSSRPSRRVCHRASRWY